MVSDERCMYHGICVIISVGSDGLYYNHIGTSGGKVGFGYFGTAYNRWEVLTTVL